jgi:hypothetical protein
MAAVGDLSYRANPQWSRERFRKGIVVTLLAAILLPDLHNASGQSMPLHIRWMCAGVIGAVVGLIVVFTGPGRILDAFSVNCPESSVMFRNADLFGAPMTGPSRRTVNLGEPVVDS